MVTQPEPGLRLPYKYIADLSSLLLLLLLSELRRSALRGGPLSFRRTGTSVVGVMSRFNGSMASRSRDSTRSLVGENPLRLIVVGGAISGGR